ncbi:hypothetical protein DUNSADRAFT_263 [Dunaliella salina]|uniref:Uncharacterized protein n=1 Tax=Dunaliella salina TaxID=3046 RepID=A0ABQ7FZ93_DUNSA|nr:hypothetical protein DUNSADRAFT_263 [Dunaliella salina]|eukprot:KAF5827669.1 hypothetical protein DUNSADRAFT_263 [Dunaliella salina]
MNSAPEEQACKPAQRLQQAQQTSKSLPADGGILGQPEPVAHNSDRGHTESSQGWDAQGPLVMAGAEIDGPMQVHNTQARHRRHAHDSAPVYEHHQQTPPPQQTPVHHEQQQPLLQQWLWPWGWHKSPSPQSSCRLYSKPLWLPFFGSRCWRSQPLWGCFRTIRTEMQLLSVCPHVRLLTCDQGIFVHRSALEKLGGFQEWPLLEDVDMVKRLKRDVSPPAILPLDMFTSGRRWLHTGFWRNTAFNQVILAAWALGYDPHTLASWYYRPRR